MHRKNELIASWFACPNNFSAAPRVSALVIMLSLLSQYRAKSSEEAACVLLYRTLSVYTRLTGGHSDSLQAANSSARSVVVWLIALRTKVTETLQLRRVETTPTTTTSNRPMRLHWRSRNYFLGRKSRRGRRDGEYDSDRQIKWRKRETFHRTPRKLATEMVGFGAVVGLRNLFEEQFSRRRDLRGWVARFAKVGH